MKFQMSVTGLDFEVRKVWIPNDQATFEKRKKWYEARGWELVNVGTVIIGKPECELTFRRVKVGSIEAASGRDGANGEGRSEPPGRRDNYDAQGRLADYAEREDAKPQTGLAVSYDLYRHHPLHAEWVIYRDAAWAEHRTAIGFPDWLIQRVERLDGLLALEEVSHKSTSRALDEIANALAASEQARQAAEASAAVLRETWVGMVPASLDGLSYNAIMRLRAQALASTDAGAALLAEVTRLRERAKRLRDGIDTAMRHTYTGDDLRALAVIENTRNEDDAWKKQPDDTGGREGTNG